MASGCALQSLNLADDISLIAKDDILGRKLQDLKMLPKQRASKKGPIF